MNQRQILFSILKEIEPNFDAECQAQLDKNSSNWSMVALYLLNDIALNLKKLKQFLDKVIDQSTRRSNFPIQNISSFQEIFIKLKVIDGIGLKQKMQVNQIIKFNKSYKSLPQFIQAIKNSFNIKDMVVQEFVQMVLQDKRYTRLFKSQKTQIQDSSVDFTAEQSQELQQKLQLINNRLQDCKNSQLDYHIQSNLFKSLKEKIRKLKKKSSSQIYEKNQYIEFKSKLVQILKLFQLLSSQIQAQLALDLTQDQDYYNKILKIRSVIHPIYLPELFALKEKNDSMIPNIKDKNIITILGVTGAGKSTVIQMLLGYKMKLIKFNRKSKNLTTLSPFGGLKKEHKDFIAKPSQHSITKHISGVQVPFEINESIQNLFLVDTPGFFDTGGVIVDTCNALSTVQILKQANSIRFIFLLNKNNWGNRGEGLRKLASIISRLFKTYSSNKFMYFLNCFDDQQLQELPKKIQNLKQSLNQEEKSDKKFNQVINHLQRLLKQASQKAQAKGISIKQAIQQHSDQIVVIDPQKSDIKKIKQKISREQRETIQVDKIMQDLLVNQSRVAIKRQVYTFKKIIEKSIQKDRSSCGIYYLEMLKKLQTLFRNIGENSNKATQILRQLNNRLKRDLQALKKKVTELFQIIQKSKFYDNTRLDQIYEMKNLLLRKQRLYNQFLFDQIPLKFDESVKSMTTNLLYKIKQKFDNGPDINSQLYQKIWWVSEKLQEDQSTKQKLQEQTLVRIEKLQKEVKTKIQNATYSKIEEDLDRINLLYGLLASVKPAEPLNNSRKRFDSQWTNMLAKQINQQFNQFKKCFIEVKYEFEIQQDKIKIAKNIINNFGEIIKPQRQEFKQISKLKDQMIEQIKKNVTRNIEIIKNVIKNSDTCSIISAKNFQAFEITEKNINMILKYFKEYCLEIQFLFQLTKRDLRNQIQRKNEIIQKQIYNINKCSPQRLQELFMDNYSLSKLANYANQSDRKKLLQKTKQFDEKLQIYFDKMEIIRQREYSYDIKFDKIEELCQFYKKCHYITQTKYQVKEEKNFVNMKIFQTVLDGKKLFTQKFDSILKNIDKEVEEKSKMIGLGQKIYRVLNQMKKTSQFLICFQNHLKDQEIFSKQQEKLSIIKDNFQKSLKNIIFTKKKESIEKFRKIRQKIKNQIQKKVFQNSEFHELKQIQQMWQNFFLDNKTPKKLIQQNQIDFDQQDFIQLQMREIQKSLSISFEQAISQDKISQCSKIMTCCSKLIPLDGNKKNFEIKYKEFRQQMQNKFEWLNQNKIGCFTDEGFLDEFLFRKKMEYSNEFRNDQGRLINTTKQCESVDFWLQKQQNSIKTCIKQCFINESYISNKQYKNTIKNIQDFYKNYIQVQNILKDCQNIRYKLKIDINSTKKDICEYFNTIFKSIVKQIKDLLDKSQYTHIQRQNNKLKVYENVLKQIHEDQFKKIVSQILNQFYQQESKQKQIEQLSQFHDILIQERIMGRKKKYFGNNPQLGEGLKQQYDTFNQEEKKQFKANLLRCFQKKKQNLRNQSITEHYDIIKNKFDLHIEETENLSPELKSQILKMLQQQKQNIWCDYKKKLEDIVQNFKMQAIFTDLRKQKNKGIREKIIERANKQFNQFIQKLKYPETSNQYITNHIFKNYIQVFKEKEVNSINDGEQKRKIQSILEKLKQYLQLLLKKIYQNFAKKFKSEKQRIPPKHSNINDSLAAFLQFFQFLQKNKTFFKFSLRQQKERFIKFFDQDILSSQNQNISIKTGKLTQKTNQKLIKRYLYKQCVGLVANELKKYEKIEQFCLLKNKIEKYLKKENEIYNSIQLEIKQIRSKVDAFNLFKQTMINDNHEKIKNYFLKFEEDLQSLNSISKFSDQILNENIEKFIEQKKQRVTNQFRAKIQFCFAQLKKSFDSLDYEFKPIHNIVFKVVKIGKELNILSIKNESERLSVFFKDTKQLFSSTRAIIEKEQKLLLEKKKNWKKIQDDIQNESKILFSKISNKLVAQKEQKQRKIKDNKDKNIGIEGISQQQKKKIEDEYKSEINLIQKQHQQTWKQQYNNNKKEMEKKMNQIVMQRQSSIKQYIRAVTIFYKAFSEVDTKQINIQQTMSLKQLQILINSQLIQLGNKVISSSYKYLKEMKNRYSQMIIESCKALYNINSQQWTAKTKGNDIDYVIKELQISESNQHQLRQKYRIYKKAYQESIQKYQTNPTQKTIEIITQNTREIGANNQKYYLKNGNKDSFTPEKLIANIFSIWTITLSEVEDEKVKFYYQPHPAQIVSIFLILNLIQNKPRELTNIVAQINTGQGKSLVLAGLSCYFALSGFEVSCICYSSYLSKRDLNAFDNLFFTLGIRNKIFYGTFYQICQIILNSKYGKSQGLREDLKKFINQPGDHNNHILKDFSQSIYNLCQKKKRKVLLIDQIDVFFDPNFFGKLFTPDCEISSKEVNALLQLVWIKYKNKNMVEGSLSPKQIEQSEQYAILSKKMGKMSHILKQQVKGMILGCQSVNHEYIVQEDLIKYKDQDGFSSKISLGYKTIFAYLKEYDNKRITLSSCHRALKIGLVVAQFSYAQLPKYFSNIFGVTGTYATLPDYKKKYMQEQYKIKQCYLIPSVYGKNRRRKILDPIIVQPDQHFRKLVQQIKLIHDHGRPILVFFKSNLELQGFYNSPIYQQFQSQEEIVTSFVNETHSEQDRDKRIKRVCQKKNITFMTSSFGRGTDFKIYDEQVLKIDEGGLHLIQTFLSLEESEQAQIQGRTARQGDPGTYKLIVSNNELESLELTYRKQYDQADVFYEDLKIARIKINENKKQKVEQDLNESRKRHETCFNIYKNSQNKEIQQLILDLNKFPEINLNNHSKTIILIDGTCSMSNTLDHLLKTISQILNETLSILSKTQQKKAVKFQICIYRNYNSLAQKLLQYSEFTNDPKILTRFLQNIKAEGGWINEAIQVGYWHINRCDGVTQCILLADAMANTQNEVVSKREKIFKQPYWKQNNIPLLSQKQQIKKIKSKKIPIHSFYIGNKNQVQSYFQQISNQTGGMCQNFNPTAIDAKKKLSDFIGERVLESTTEDKQLAAKMVKQYRDRKINSK